MHGSDKNAEVGSTFRAHQILSAEGLGLACPSVVWLSSNSSVVPEMPLYCWGQTQEVKAWIQNVYFSARAMGAVWVPWPLPHQHGGTLRLDRLAPHGADVGNLTGQSLLMSRGV